MKGKANGSIVKYKTRLMTKGYTQKKGIDYLKTYSLVVRFALIHLILAIMAHMDSNLH